MVHALETVHRFLKPGGKLVDIHPTGKPPPVVVRMGSDDYLAGAMQETDDFIEYTQASTALAEVCNQGLFHLERQAKFTFAEYASNLNELLAFLAGNWEDAVVPAKVKRRIRHYYGILQGEKEVVILEQVGISHLTRTWQTAESILTITKA